MDNAWDAEARVVKLTLPDILSEEPVVIEARWIGRLVAGAGESSDRIRLVHNGLRGGLAKLDINREEIGALNEKMVE